MKKTNETRKTERIVYLVRNTENDKLYVGITCRNLDYRWNEHLKDARNESRRHRPLQRAINKYGKEKFKPEVIERFTTTDKVAKQKEIDYIAFHDSYKNGYNATKGGDGTWRCDVTVEEAREAYYKYEGLGNAARAIGISEKTIRPILKEAGIVASNDRNGCIKSVGVLLIREEGNKAFNSMTEAGVWVRDNLLTHIKKPVKDSSARKAVKKALDTNKSWHGYRFQYQL